MITDVLCIRSIIAAACPTRSKASWSSRSPRARCSTSRRRTACSSSDGEHAYIALQFARLDVPASEGVAFPLVKKLLAFNTADTQRVEVVILSKNDPVSGLRVFRSAEQRRAEARARRIHARPQPLSLPRALKANLFLSANENDVMARSKRKCPAARVYPGVGAGRGPARRRGAHRLRRRRGAVLR